MSPKGGHGGVRSGKGLGGEDCESSCWEGLNRKRRLGGSRHNKEDERDPPRDDSMFEKQEPADQTSAQFARSPAGTQRFGARGDLLQSQARQRPIKEAPIESLLSLSSLDSQSPKTRKTTAARITRNGLSHLGDPNPEKGPASRSEPQGKNAPYPTSI